MSALLQITEPLPYNACLCGLLAKRGMRLTNTSLHAYPSPLASP